MNEEVKRMLKEDSIIGRWVRITFPQEFELILERAKQDAKRRAQRQTKQKR